MACKIQIYIKRFFLKENSSEEQYTNSEEQYTTHIEMSVLL